MRNLNQTPEVRGGQDLGENQAPEFLEVEIKWLGSYRKIRLPKAEMQPEDSDIIGYVVAVIDWSKVTVTPATVNYDSDVLALVLAYHPPTRKVYPHLLVDSSAESWTACISPYDPDGAWVSVDELYKHIDLGEEVLETIFWDIRQELDREHWELVKEKDPAIRAVAEALQHFTDHYKTPNLPVEVKISEAPSRTTITVKAVEGREDTITITSVPTTISLPNMDNVEVEAEQAFVNGKLYAIALKGSWDFVKAFRVGNSHVVAVPFQGPAVRCRCGQLVILKPL